MKLSVSEENTITDSRNVKTSEPEYEAITTDPKPNIEADGDVIVNANPSYHSDVKMEANPAYQ